MTQRIIDLSYKHKLSHLGSNLTMSTILEQIYNEKEEDDIVILSAGHAGLSQYVQIEHHSNNKINAEDMLESMGIHPKIDRERGIFCSSGSLGCGILVAVGFALANKNRKVYCALSDGECAEGSVWEALAFCEKNKLDNIIIHVNINGFSAYDEVDRSYLENRLRIFFPRIHIHQTTNPYLLGGLNAHYHVLKTHEEVEKLMEEI